MTFDEFCTEYERINGDFMVPELTGYIDWWYIATENGDFYIPVEGALDRSCLPDSWEMIECVQGYGMRLTAPGYLDCTDWTVCEDELDLIEDMARVCLEDCDE